MKPTNKKIIEHNKADVKFYFFKPQHDTESPEEYATHAVERTFFDTRWGYETYAKMKDGSVKLVGLEHDTSD